jgi:hypothetical protein
MKNMTLKVIAAGILLISFTLNTYGQHKTVKTTEKTEKKPAKLEKTKIPKAVTDIYIKEYLAPTDEYWYGYPEFDYENDWYGYNPYLFEYQHPEYFLVEFTANGTPYKVIYSKSGKKIATHRKLKTELPDAVKTAIGKGEYSTWTLGKEKEEIFRDTEMDKMKVYKVDVEKGKEKHILFYSADGDLLKDKTIKP